MTNLTRFAPPFAPLLPWTGVGVVPPLEHSSLFCIYLLCYYCSLMHSYIILFISCSFSLGIVAFPPSLTRASAI